MFKELNEFAAQYEDSMFNAYTRVWEVGAKLSRYWKSVGIDIPNPFYAEDRALPSVELKEALFILAPYYSATPNKFFEKRSEIDYECVQIACDTVMDFIYKTDPKQKRVCITTMSNSFADTFDEVFVYNTDKKMVSSFDTQVTCEKDLLSVLSEHKYNDVWIEASLRLLRTLGVRALGYTVYNPYSNKKMTDILFTDDHEYHLEYEEYLVVGWCTKVREYEYHICDIRQNIINAHYCDFMHKTDDAFEKALMEEE